MRDGKVVAREGFLLDRLTEPEAVLAVTIQQYYADGRYVPRELLVPEDGRRTASCSRRGSRERRGDASCRSAVPQRGEKLRLLELVVRNARLAFDLEWKHPRKQSQEILRALQDLLDLEVEPRRIECFDISNIQGSDIVASMVCFEDGASEEVGLPEVPDQDRVGRAPTTSPPCARWWGGATSGCSRRARTCPTSCSIDGGKGQLGAAVDALDELGLGDQPLASLAKQEELIFVRGRDEPIALPRASPVLQLVQRVRDEAHRFAVGFHRKARSSRGPSAPSSTTSRASARPSARRCSSRFGSRAGRARRERGRAARPRWARPRPRGSAAHFDRRAG